MGHLDDCQKNNCQKLAIQIKEGVRKSGLGFKKFIENFISENEKVKNGDIENELESYESYKKMFYRVKKGEQTSDKTLEKLREIYDFLLKQDAYKRVYRYKPLVDDSFEREILGDEICDQIEQNSISKFNNYTH